MTMIEAIEARHSVRSYTGAPIEPVKREALAAAVQQANEASGLSLQIIYDEPEAFGKSLMARYGKFENANNYIACVGPDVPGLDEAVGYYGELIVLKAQELGLNTCWVGLTFSKRRCAAKIESGQRMVCVISLGYGSTQGKPRRTKPVGDLCSCNGGSFNEGAMPDWFEQGMRAAQLAPTAINQQKFLIELHEGNVVSAQALKGPYSIVDLGIVRCHFELAANDVSRGWSWADWGPASL